MDFRSLPQYRPDAPGAVLDAQPWAASWPAYLAAVFSPHDSSARQFIANAWSERVPSRGGFLVPEQLRAQVLAYVTPAVVRKRAMVLPMDAYRLHVPVVDNPSQASGKQALGGLTFSFTEDDEAITPSAPGFAQAVLQASKLAALVPVPNELVSDAAGALGDFIARVVAIGYQWTEEDFFIGANGTGAGCPQSILNADCAVKVARTGSPVNAADVAAMLAAFHPAALTAGLTPGMTDAGWLISVNLLSAILQMYLVPGGSAATAGAPAALPSWLNLGDGHQVGPSILGLPAKVTDHQPAAGTTGDLMLCDLSNYLIGDRLEMTVEPSSDGSGFITDITNYRVKSRIDGRYYVPGSTTTEASEIVSPVVVLQ